MGSPVTIGYDVIQGVRMGKMKRRSVFALSSAGFALTVLLAFQNCGQGFHSTGENSLSLSSSSDPELNTKFASDAPEIERLEQASPACQTSLTRSLKDVLVMASVPPRAGRSLSISPLVTGFAAGSARSFFDSDPAFDRTREKKYYFIWANRCVLPSMTLFTSQKPLDSNNRLVNLPQSLRTESNCRTFANANSDELRSNIVNPKPNPLDIAAAASVQNPSLQITRYWSFFTSFQKANACTRMRMWAALGKQDVVARIAANAGFANKDVLTSVYHSQLQKSAYRFNGDYKELVQVADEEGAQWPKDGQFMLIDQCVALDPNEVHMAMNGQTAVTPLRDRIKGFYLDYEVQDLRSQEMSNNFIQMMAEELNNHSDGQLGIILFLNALHAAAVAGSGLDSSGLHTILTRPGIVGIPITDYHRSRRFQGQELSVTQELQLQLNILKNGANLSPASRRKIFVLYAFKNMEKANSLAERWASKRRSAADARNFALNNDLGGATIWWDGMNLESAAASGTCPQEDWKVLQCLTSADAVGCN